MPSHRAGATFASLRNPNYRLYFLAQTGSSIGAWIQITAENWFVLRLTDSGLALGITNALQFGPLVLFGLYGGVIADRFDRRRLLIVTQTVLAALAALIGVLVAADLVRLWMIWSAALALGLITCVDKPALLGFLKDLVGDAELGNATALNQAVISGGRMVGPAVGGVLIASFGLSPSFFVNAVSFALVVVVLLILDASRLNGTVPAGRKAGQVREGLAYVRGNRALTLTVIAMFVIFVTVYNFQVLVPVLTSRVLGGSSALYGVAMSTLGLGAVTGSLLIASRVKPGPAVVAVLCGVLGFVHIWLALPVGLYGAIAGLFLLGVTCGFFSVTVAGTLQLMARDDMRGRVMALYGIALGGSLIGGPLSGALTDSIGVSGTYLAIAAICGCTVVWVWARHARRRG